MVHSGVGVWAALGASTEGAWEVREVQSSLAVFLWAFSGQLSLLVLTRGLNPNSGCRVCAKNKDPASNYCLF